MSNKIRKKFQTNHGWTKKTLNQ